MGIETRATVHWNLVTARLVELAVARGEGKLSADGPLVVETGQHTGRSAQDKFTVRDAETEDSVWWGKSNKPMDPAHFAALKADFLAALREKGDLFVQDLFGGSQPGHRVRVRVVNELAWHNLFIRTMLVRPEEAELKGFVPDYTIIDLPSFRADPARHGCRGETVIAVNLTEKLILIGGTKYAGEMKKSVFGILNYLLPTAGVMPMLRDAHRLSDLLSARRHRRGSLDFDLPEPRILLDVEGAMTGIVAALHAVVTMRGYSRIWGEMSLEIQTITPSSVRRWSAITRSLVALT